MSIFTVEWFSLFIFLSASKNHHLTFIRDVYGDTSRRLQIEKHVEYR